MVWTQIAFSRGRTLHQIGLPCMGATLRRVTFLILTLCIFAKCLLFILRLHHDDWRRQSTLYSLCASWFYMRRIQRRTKPQDAPQNPAGDWFGAAQSMVSYLFCLQSFSIRMTQPSLRTLSMTRLRQHLRPRWDEHVAQHSVACHLLLHVTQFDVAMLLTYN